MQDHGERRRGAPRLKTFLRAEIVDDRTVRICECIVVDLSDTGAQLFVAERDEIPQQFWLHIRGRKLKERVELVRRLGEAVGVRFIGPQTRT